MSSLNESMTVLTTLLIAFSSMAPPDSCQARLTTLLIFDASNVCCVDLSLFRIILHAFFWVCVASGISITCDAFEFRVIRLFGFLGVHNYLLSSNHPIPSHHLGLPFSW